MKIVVVGCGKHGLAIIGSLLEEGHDVTAVDIDEGVISNISDQYDVMCVCGDGTDYDTLLEAGVAEARLFISMTPRDEVNILSCFLAKRIGAHHSVARIEDPLTTDKALAFIKEQTSISMFLNPAKLNAQEMVNMLKLPAGMRAEYFARRSFELLEFRLPEDSGLNGLSLFEMRKIFKEHFLICSVARGEEVFVPLGDFVLQAGDRITINASPREIDKLLKHMGYIQSNSRSVMILGGSHTAYHLGRMLLDMGVGVKIIDQDRQRCRELCDALPEAVIINADGARGELLMEEGLSRMDAFVSLTGMDEENILMAIYASSQNVKKCVCKIDRIEFLDMASKMGLEGIVRPQQLMSESLVRYARAIENSTGSNVETLYKLMGGRVEALEFNVRDTFKYRDTPLSELRPRLKKNTLIGGIIRNGRSIIPDGHTVIKGGDRVIVVTTETPMYDLGDMLKGY